MSQYSQRETSIRILKARLDMSKHARRNERTPKVTWPCIHRTNLIKSPFKAPYSLIAKISSGNADFINGAERSLDVDGAIEGMGRLVAPSARR